MQGQLCVLNKPQASESLSSILPLQEPKVGIGIPRMGSIFFSLVRPFASFKLSATKGGVLMNRVARSSGKMFAVESLAAFVLVV